MSKEQWIADVERLEERFADGGDEVEPNLTDAAVAIPRMINSIVADMDELCAAANRPETSYLVEADAPAFGQIALRCHLILGFLEARKTPALKIVRSVS